VLTPRRIIIVAALLQVAHVVPLTLLDPDGAGGITSNLIQLAMGLLCVAATLKAGRGGQPFERRFLALVAARYVIWAVAQGLATYAESHGNMDFAGSPADILFHLESVPLGIAFFLEPGRDTVRTDRPHPLDLAQILFFWAAMAFYIVYLASDSPASVGQAAAAHALVAGCFYIRAMTSRSTVASALFGRWTPAILLSGVNDAYSGFYDSTAGASFDLIWSLEMLIWIITAATWRTGRVEHGTLARRIVDRTVSLLPLVVAAFTLVLSLGLAQRKPKVAVALVVVALGCSVLRLLARRRQAAKVGATPAPGA
jgi:hypothetical protein